MRRATFACVGIGLLLLAAGCTMCAHPYDYCGPVYDGPCVSCGPCGGECAPCGEVPCDGGSCGGGCGDCGTPDDICRPCVSRAGSILSGPGPGGAIPAGALIEGVPEGVPGPGPTPAAAPTPATTEPMTGSPALDAGAVIEQGPAIPY